MRRRAAVSVPFVLWLLGCDGGKPAVAMPDSADGTVRAVVEQIKAGNARVVYDALPASYQEDLGQLVHEFGRQMDDEVLRRGFGAVDKVRQLLRTKKDWLLEGMQALYGSDVRDRLAHHWDSFTGFVDVVARSDLRSTAKLQTLDLGRFLGTTGSELLGHCRAMSAMLPGDPFAELATMAFEPGAGQEGTTGVQMLRNGKESGRPEQFVRVEGRWIFADLAERWTKFVAESRKGIATMDLARHKPEVLYRIASVEKVLDGLLAATEKEPFKAQMRGVLAEVDGLDRILRGRR